MGKIDCSTLVAIMEEHFGLPKDRPVANEELSSCPDCLGTGCIPCLSCDGEGTVVSEPTEQKEDKSG